MYNASALATNNTLVVDVVPPDSSGGAGEAGSGAARAAPAACLSQACPSSCLPARHALTAGPARLHAGIASYNVTCVPTAGGGTVEAIGLGDPVQLAVGITVVRRRPRLRVCAVAGGSGRVCQGSWRAQAARCVTASLPACMPQLRFMLPAHVPGSTYSISAAASNSAGEGPVSNTFTWVAPSL